MTVLFNSTWYLILYSYSSIVARVKIVILLVTLCVCLFVCLFVHLFDGLTWVVRFYSCSASGRSCPCFKILKRNSEATWAGHIAEKYGKELRKKAQKRIHNDCLSCSWVFTCHLNKLRACRLYRLTTLQKEGRLCTTTSIPVVVRSSCGSATARLLGSRVRIPLRA